MEPSGQQDAFAVAVEQPHHRVAQQGPQAPLTHLKPEDHSAALLGPDVMTHAAGESRQHVRVELLEGSAEQRLTGIAEGHQCLLDGRAFLLQPLPARVDDGLQRVLHFRPLLVLLPLRALQPEPYQPGDVAGRSPSPQRMARQVRKPLLEGFHQLRLHHVVHQALQLDGQRFHLPVLAGLQLLVRLLGDDLHGLRQLVDAALDTAQQLARHRLGVDLV